MATINHNAPESEPIPRAGAFALKKLSIRPRKVVIGAVVAAGLTGLAVHELNKNTTQPTTHTQQTQKVAKSTNQPTANFTLGERVQVLEKEVSSALDAIGNYGKDINDIKTTLRDHEARISKIEEVKKPVAARKTQKSAVARPKSNAAATNEVAKPADNKTSDDADKKKIDEAFEAGKKSAETDINKKLQDEQRAALEQQAKGIPATIPQQNNQPQQNDPNIPYPQQQYPVPTEPIPQPIPQSAYYVMGAPLVIGGIIFDIGFGMPLCPWPAWENPFGLYGNYPYLACSVWIGGRYPWRFWYQGRGGWERGGYASSGRLGGHNNGNGANVGNSRNGNVANSSVRNTSNSNASNERYNNMLRGQQESAARAQEQARHVAIQQRALQNYRAYQANKAPAQAYHQAQAPHYGGNVAVAPHQGSVGGGGGSRSGGGGSRGGGRR